MEEKSVITALGPSRFLNREVSWIRFAERVIELAADNTIPLLERVKFLAIFSTGLDEFFQVRVAGLKDRLAASVRSKSSDGMSTKEQLKAIRNELEPILDRVGKIYNQDIVAGLKEHGIEIASFDELGDDDRRTLSEIFEKRIFPVLTPIALDPAHPFPYISNLSLSLLVTVSDPISNESRVARIKVPAILPRFVPIGDSYKFVTLESVIAAHLNRLFPEMTIGNHYSFRVTRNADLSLEEEEADDLLELVEIELRRRRFGRAVRVEVSRGTPSTAIDLIAEELRLHRDDIYEVDFPIDLSGLWQVHAIGMPEISAPSFSPITPQEFSESNTGRRADIFEVLRSRDILLHHPYTSFSNTVEAFIEQAAIDPNVLAIKQTLYRTSGDSRMMAALIRAAEAGKQVAVLVELKARFDELANISWAKRLEEAGVHVVYGLMGLKTHIKAALVIRNEDEGVRLYCHLGTGNYNAKTARSYEDLGLLSADSELNRDLAEAFNLLTGFSRPGDFSKIVLAPSFLRNRIMELIDEQAQKGSDGRIVIKVNNLTDSSIIDALYNASNHGVTIDIIARGICCLRPGVPGLSENIRVKSIVGKLLEHSRIFAFGGSGNANPFKVYVGSADLMERNLDRRIEAIFPISQASDIAQVEEILKLCAADDQYSWTMNGSGFYERETSLLGISVQDILMEQANIEARKPAPSLM
ncbi:MAG: polyphosphate kinase 1 [Actinomycetota bacterium]|nr:polyphosphate kinase 1 [Actinomycetota bacterium]